MSTAPPFREEALAHHRAQRGPGSVLRIAPRWTRRAFWALALAAIAAIAAGALVQVDRVTFLPATVRGAEVSALLPAGLAEKVKAGDRARVIPAGVDGVGARVASVGGTGPAPGTVRVTARADRSVRSGAALLRVRIGSRSLLADLVPGLSS